MNIDVFVEKSLILHMNDAKLHTLAGKFAGKDSKVVIMKAFVHINVWNYVIQDLVLHV